jgi:hypothetical protein
MQILTPPPLLLVEAKGDRFQNETRVDLFLLVFSWKELCCYQAYLVHCCRRMVTLAQALLNQSDLARVLSARGRKITWY